MKKIIIISIVFISAFALFGYYYVIYGGARNIASEDASYSVTSKGVLHEFEAAVEKSNKKYLEKVISIEGIVTNSNGNQIILDQKIVCEVKEVGPVLKMGETITLKGRVVGYDDLMGDLKLDQCFVITNE